MHRYVVVFHLTVLRDTPWVQLLEMFSVFKLVL